MRALHVFSVLLAGVIRSRQFVIDGIEPSTVKAHKPVLEPGRESLSHHGGTPSFHRFKKSLIRTTKAEILKCQKNINLFYGLDPSAVFALKGAFNTTTSEYESLLHSNYNTIINEKNYNGSIEFMLEFIDLSNYIVEKIWSLKVEALGKSVAKPTQWKNLNLGQKIVKQQILIATNSIESQMCTHLRVCAERSYYTDYVLQWLRGFLGLNALKLKMVYEKILDLLKDNLHFLKSNINFRQRIKALVKSPPSVQRDTFYLLDEIVTEQEKVLEIVPNDVKTAAQQLYELFSIIDGNYDMNYENEDALDDISANIMSWTRDGDVNLKRVLQSVLENMQLNLKIWPLDIQSKIEVIWSKIISL